MSDHHRPEEPHDHTQFVPYYEDGITLYNGGVLDVLAALAPESVDCVVTSPPYWSLRNYSGEQGRIWGGDPTCEHAWQAEPIKGEGYTGITRWQHVGGRSDAPAGTFSTNLGTQHYCACGAWRGAYGLEPTHLLYVEHTVEVLRAIRRVLKPTGVVWWNIGDSYAAGGRGGGAPDCKQQTSLGSIGLPPFKAPGLKAKDLCLIPQRVAIALQDDGWYVRCDVVWSKPNPMPESVTDRPTKSHEYVWLLSKSARYWWDADAVREPLAPSSVQRINQPTFDQQTGGEKDYANGVNGNRSARGALVNLRKRNDRIGGNKGGQVHHSEGAMYQTDESGRNIRSVWTMATQPSPLPHFASFPEELPTRCIKAACPPDGTVLDPFSGTGTTLKVARDLGRKAIGIEVSAEYFELARKRLVYGVKGVLAIDAGQGALL